MNLKKRILVAPLNWGLGHATRCIPIIRALVAHDFEPVIGSDGAALALLRKEFPDLKTIELPSYNIEYSKKGYFFKLKMLKDSPKLLKSIKDEQKATNQILKELNIEGVISDNRFGIYSKKVPSVFITHQLQVLSGTTTWMSSKLHQRIIKKFDECWVPDNRGEVNLSGKLGHTTIHDMTIKYIGPLSRFKLQDLNIKHDILILLSGPEPQRSMLEDKLMREFKHCKKNILLIRGVISEKKNSTQIGSITCYDFMTSLDLEKAINESQLIISRSGYTTIMDLAKLNKKAFFIPTPGQFEQEYLAKKLTEQQLVPSCTQDEFTIKKLDNIESFKGLDTIDYDVNYKNLFRLF